MCSYPLQAYTCFCLVPLMTHSASSINVTLKCWLRGRSRSLKMDRQIIYDLLLVCHCNYSSLSLAPFSSYLALSNIMTLKSRLGVTQCHWKWHQSIDRIEFLFVFRCNYGRILCCFRDKAARAAFEIKQRDSGRKTPIFSSPRTPFRFFSKYLIRSVRVPGLLRSAEVLPKT